MKITAKKHHNNHFRQDGAEEAPQPGVGPGLPGQEGAGGEARVHGERKQVPGGGVPGVCGRHGDHGDKEVGVRGVNKISLELAFKNYCLMGGFAMTKLPFWV